MKKCRAIGYRSRWSGWRYRAHCPCGWSCDVPAEFFDRIFINLDEHRKGCRK